jgi:hypothetical protein
MSGGITASFVDFVVFSLEIDRVRCVPERSFLVRNWCGPPCQPCWSAGYPHGEQPGCDSNILRSRRWDLCPSQMRYRRCSGRARQEMQELTAEKAHPILQNAHSRIRMLHRIQRGSLAPNDRSGSDSDLLDLTDEVVAKALSVRRDSADRRVWKMDRQNEG